MCATTRIGRTPSRRLANVRIPLFFLGFAFPAARTLTSPPHRPARQVQRHPQGVLPPPAEILRVLHECHCVLLSYSISLFLDTDDRIPFSPTGHSDDGWDHRQW